MTLGTTTARATSPHMFDMFLGELTGFLFGVPGTSLTGSPQEIVEAVVRETDRFADCDEKCVEMLSRGLVMSVRAKGQRLGLTVETLPLLNGQPNVRVTFHQASLNPVNSAR